MSASLKDEFSERARLAAENQELARDYLRLLARRARLAFGVGAAGILAMWLAWTLYRSPARSSPQPPPVIVVR